QKGDILGHEFMGEVVEVGKEVQFVKPGDRVVVPFNIACGACFFCERKLWSCCDNTNPNADVAAKLDCVGLHLLRKLFYEAPPPAQTQPPPHHRTPRATEDPLATPLP